MKAVTSAETKALYQILDANRRPPVVNVGIDACQLNLLPDTLECDRCPARDAEFLKITPDLREFEMRYSQQVNVNTELQHQNKGLSQLID